MDDTDRIEVVVTRDGITEPPRYYPLDRLQELMDRANAAFGNPEVQLDGPKTSPEPERLLPYRPKKRR